MDEMEQKHWALSEALHILLNLDSPEDLLKFAPQFLDAIEALTSSEIGVYMLGEQADRVIKGK